MQLKVQHVQALQTLNSEVVILQTQIYQELKALPFVTSVESLFVNNKQKQRCSHAKHQQDILDFKASLFSLLAELIDSSCHALKTDLARTHLLRYAAPFLESIDDLDRDRRSLIEKHFHWICIVYANGCSGKSRLDTIIAGLVRYPNHHQQHPSLRSTNASVKLALLPDYRSKTLYLASMVDMDAVDAIFGVELQQRLDELFAEEKFLSTSSSDSNRSPISSIMKSYSPVVRETLPGIELDDIVVLDCDNADNDKLDNSISVSSHPVLRVIIDMNDIDEDEYPTTTSAENDDDNGDIDTSSTPAIESPKVITSINTDSPPTPCSTVKSSKPSCSSSSSSSGQKMKFDEEDLLSSSCENENSKPNILNVAT